MTKIDLDLPDNETTSEMFVRVAKDFFWIDNIWVRFVLGGISAVTIFSVFAVLAHIFGPLGFFFGLVFLAGGAIALVMT